MTHPTLYFTPCFSHVINVKKSCSLTFAQILMLWYCKIPTLYNASAFANCSPLDKVIFVCVPQYDKVHLQTLTCPESIWSSWHVSQRGTLDMVQSLTRAKHPLRLTKSSRGFHIIREMPTELYQRYHSRACIAADITPGRRAHFKWLRIRHSMGNLNLFEVVKLRPESLVSLSAVGELVGWHAVHILVLVFHQKAFYELVYLPFWCGQKQTP